MNSKSFLSIVSFMILRHRLFECELGGHVPPPLKGGNWRYQSGLWLI